MNLRLFTYDRIRETLIELLSEISSAVYLCPISYIDDFRKGEWTPLNVNHDNPILKYIALSACKTTDIWDYFFKNYQHEVMEVLKTDFELFYQRDPVQAHNVAVEVKALFYKMDAYMVILCAIGAREIYQASLKWGNINPAEIAENDWR